MRRLSGKNEFVYEKHAHMLCAAKSAAGAPCVLFIYGEESRMEKQTIVVKVGTSSLTKEDGSLNPEQIMNITSQMAELYHAGNRIILVSSGAVAAGFRRLGFHKRPVRIADKQAAAAVGQGLLMEEYTREFHQYQIPCAQILLNRSDFEDRRRYKNIFSSISVLLNRGAVPVINENDTIAIEELKLGDNDTLSAQVAAIDACRSSGSADGYRRPLYGESFQGCDARHIDVVEKVTDELIRGAGGAGSSNGTGGMRTKLTAARLATRAAFLSLSARRGKRDRLWEL